MEKKLSFNFYDDTKAKSIMLPESLIQDNSAHTVFMIRQKKGKEGR
jgi:hypothetical protein